MKSRYLIILFLFVQSFCFSQDIVINEFMSMNNSTIIDDFGESSDWIELYNNSSQDINLYQWCLSDEEDELNKWEFPDTTILPNEFVLIFCSNKDTISEFFHSNFKLDSGGEELFLTDDAGEIVDEIEEVELENDLSFGRKTDGNTETVIFFLSSPGQTNNFNLEQNKVLFSHDAGFYNSAVTLSLSSELASGEIYYTINGNEPHPDSSFSFLYNDPILLGDIQSTSPVYSYIPTTPEVNPQNYYSWEPPSVEKYSMVVLRSHASPLSL